MEQKPCESSEPGDDSVTPVTGDESMDTSDLRTPPGEAYARNADFSSANIRRPRKETLWHESCIPGKPPALSLSSVVLGFILLIGVVSMLTTGSPDRRARPASHQVVPDPPDAGAPPEEPAGNENEIPDTADSLNDLGFTSEAGLDQREQKRAEACREKTEQRLARIDETMILRLDDWRQPLATFQDMIVQLAGVGTGGGTWVGHAMCRNDLELEAELLEPHAETLAAPSSDSTSPKTADPEEKHKRAADWQAVRTRFESMAGALRSSIEVDEVWKEPLEQSVNGAMRAHETIAVLLDQLEDAAAAQAVIDFCDQYLSTTTQTFQPDATEVPIK